MFHFILLSILSIPVVSILLALVLIAIKKVGSLDGSDTIQFEKIKEYSGDLKPLQYYSARDGTELGYRSYQSQSENAVILLHGSSSHSRDFSTLAEKLADKDIATVFTPDLRGHGPNPEKRGDIDYITQFEDDIEDFIEMIQDEYNYENIYLGGHSSGGGLALRFGGTKKSKMIDGYILLSPFLKYNAPTIPDGPNRWALPYVPRIIGLTILNQMGLTFLNHLPVIEFNIPEEYQDGTETKRYSYRLNTGYAPENYRDDLENITQPILVIVGSDDEVFKPEGFKEVIPDYPTTELEILDGIEHLGLLFSDRVVTEIENWMSR